MIRRHAIRALMLTPGGELLLIRIVEPLSRRRLWLTPGGGREGDESPKNCLRRELHEETGLSETTIGPAVWQRDHSFLWNGERISQAETYYLVPVERFEPTASNLADPVEMRAVDGFRWWSLTEIARSPELFVPQRLAHFLERLLAEGPPPQPIDVGV